MLSIAAGLNDSLQNALRLCAETIVKDMMFNVASRKKLDGTPQTENMPSTIKQKGHDWQLRGEKDTFLKTETYEISATPQRATIIFNYPAKNGGNVGVYVTRKGYKFFGISKKAQAACRKILAGWFRVSVVPWVKKGLKSKIKNMRVE